MKKNLNFAILSAFLLLCFACDKECGDCDPPQPESLVIDNQAEAPAITVTSKKVPLVVNPYFFKEHELVYYYGDTLAVQVDFDPKGLEVDTVIVYRTNIDEMVPVVTITNFPDPLNPSLSFTYFSDEEIVEIEGGSNGNFQEIEFDYYIIYKNGKRNFKVEGKIEDSNINGFYYDMRTSSITSFVLIHSKVHNELYLYNVAGNKGNGFFYLYDIDSLLNLKFSLASLPNRDSYYYGSFLRYKVGFFNIVENPSDRFANKEFKPGIQSNYNLSDDEQASNQTRFLKVKNDFSVLYPHQIVNFYKQYADQATHKLENLKEGDKVIIYMNTTDPVGEDVLKQDYYGLMEVLYISQDGLTSDQGGSDEDYIKFKISVF